MFVTHTNYVPSYSGYQTGRDRWTIALYLNRKTLQLRVVDGLDGRAGTLSARPPGRPSTRCVGAPAGRHRRLGRDLHDDDLIPFGSDDGAGKRLSSASGGSDETGMVVEMMTTNLFSQPVFKEGAFTQRRSVRRFALRKTLRNIDLAAELGAETYVVWGAGRAESDAAKDVRAALDRMKEAIDTLCAYAIDRGYSMRFAIEPKPNEPRGDILLPTIVTLSPLSTS